MLPTLSVVMPARNSDATIGEAIEALVDQQYPSWWEVLVVSGGSRDRTVEVARSFEHRLPAITVLASDQPATPAMAQNRGIVQSRGDALVFLDSDDVVGPGYLLGLGQALAHEALVGGRVDISQINPAERIPRRRALQDRGLEVFCGYRTAVIGAAMGVRRDALDRVGLFDEDLVTQQDLDLSWRLQEAGFRATFAPEAVVHYRYRQGLQETFQQQYRYGVGEVLLFLKHRRRGMPRRSVLQVGASWVRLLLAVPAALRQEGRLRLATMSGILAGRIVGSVRARTCYF